MQPDQQNVSPDYDFILNSGAKKRGLNFNMGNTSPIKRIVIVVGGFLGLLIIFLIFKSILSGSSPATLDLDSIVKEQSLIIHVMDDDLQNQNAALNSANQSFSQTALLSMISYRSTLLNFLAKHGVKISSSDSSYYSAAIDNEFSSASSSANFNTIFDNVMGQELDNYKQDLTNTYSNVTNSQGRAILQSQYIGTQLLVRELQQQYS